MTPRAIRRIAKESRAWAAAFRRHTRQLCGAGLRTDCPCVRDKRNCRPRASDKEGRDR